jgi:carboxypeptidase C (cathepsin A)
VKQLGLKQSSFFLKELLKTGQTDFKGIKLVERNRNLKHGIKRYKTMSETAHRGSLTVNEETGYYVVKEEESVIFYSFSDSSQGIFILFNDYCS